MEKKQRAARQSAGERHQHARRLLMAGLVVALAAGCPLPYQYSKEGWAGNASAVDPSSPGITAGPTLSYSASAEGGTISNTETATTSSDTTITLQTATPGSVIYYTIDGTTPDPRASQTSRYVPRTPLTLAITTPTVDDSSRSLTVKASAIGPNMKPSLVMSATVNLQYPQAAMPIFSIPGDTYTADQSLGLSTTTEGATIYYTMMSGQGPAPRPVPGQAGTLPYSGSILVSGPSNTWTITAIAVKTQMIDSKTQTVSYTVKYDGLADPTFNPPPTTFANPATVRIDSGSGSTIWYTTDGTAPAAGTSPSIPSGGTVPLSGGASGTGALTLRAVATQTGMNPSAEKSASYIFQAAKPTRSVPGGTYNNDQAVALSTATGGAVIHYTLDGTPATFSSPAYSAPISVSTSPRTIRSIAVKNGYADSAEQADTYILKVAPPNFSLAGGNYPGSVQVALSDATSGPVTIYYTTDGSPPTVASAIYSSALSMPNGASTQIRAFAMKTGYTDSQEVTATYVIPALPTGLVVKSAWTDSIFVSWDSVPSALSYVVLRDISSSFPAPITRYSGTSRSFIDSGLSQAVTYYYKVRAVYSSGAGDPSSSSSATALYPDQAPVVQTVTTTGFAAPPVPPTAPTPDHWIGTKQPGWIGGLYTYVVWDPDYQNSSSFAIAAYSSSTLVGYWIIAGNRYITSITLDSATGNLTIVGQYGTTLVPWYTIMPW
ncbi:MAG: chitobiase/beta-hexosaminidase C-terminal domain-containing protein [Spirochaetia bacterium]